LKNEYWRITSRSNSSGIKSGTKPAPIGIWKFVFVEVGMIKKLLWLVILVLITACSVFVVDGGLDDTLLTPTATATVCVDCTAVPTVVETTEVPIEITPSQEVNETEIPTEAPIESITPDVTASVTEAPTLTVTATELPTATGTSIPTVQPTATATLAPTATATVAPTATATLAPTATATITQTATAVPPTATATIKPMTFEVQATTPVYMVNFAHPTDGCKWQGVAGQVFDDAGKPLINYIVKITGTYNGATVSSMGLTGMVSGTPYGPASYEIVLGKTAISSVDLLTIQLFDPSGKVLTEPLTFSTSADCSKNLVIINYKEK
jgi:hypothetical protein